MCVSKDKSFLGAPSSLILEPSDLKFGYSFILGGIGSPRYRSYIGFELGIFFFGWSNLGARPDLKGKLGLLGCESDCHNSFLLCWFCLLV